MITVEIGKTWTPISGNGVKFQNSSNYKLELITKDEEIAPTESEFGIMCPPWGYFKVPQSGYCWGRCRFCKVTLYENTCEVTGGGGGGSGGGSGVPIIGGA